MAHSVSVVLELEVIVVMGKSLAGASVRSPSLIPCQIRAKRGFRIACDYYVTRLIKHAGISEFHSRAELYHAALLEGAPSVTHYVPQPFQLKVGGKRYTPDCYVAQGSETKVIELKPRGEMDERKRAAVAAYIAAHRMTFVVISNEDVFAREMEARNWLTIVKTLMRYQVMDTSADELDLLSDLAGSGSKCLGDFLVPLDRASSVVSEVALFRLLHRGLVRAELNEQVLGFDTELEIAREMA